MTSKESSGAYFADEEIDPLEDQRLKVRVYLAVGFLLSASGQESELCMDF